MSRRISQVTAVFLVLVFQLLCFSPGPARANCTLMNETFDTGGPGIWRYNDATWTVQNGVLNVKGISLGKLGYAEAPLAPDDYFLIDTDVQPVTLPAETAGYGIYVFTSGNSYLEADGVTVDGLAVSVWGDGSVQLSGWNVATSDWYTFDHLPPGPAVSSVGLKFASNVFTVRINGQDSPLMVSGFLAAPAFMDKVWLFAQASSDPFLAATEVNFDNVCVDLLTPPAYTLTVTKSGTGTGTVTSSPPGISCGADCTGGYDQGTSVILTATPDVGSTFVGWSGGGCTGIGACTVTLNAAATVNALFTETSTTLQAPKNFTYVLLDNMLSLGWNAVSGALGYKIGIGFLPGSYFGDFEAGSGLQMGPLDVTGASGTYYLAVKAYNSYQESGYSNEVAITVSPTSGLQAPKNLRYTINGSMLTIQWDGVGGAVGYEAGLGIQSGIYDGPYDLGNITQVGPFDISEVVPGTHYIAVRAYNNAGGGGYSNEIVLKLPLGE